MSSISRDETRKLLKGFGIAVDEAVIAYLARNPEVTELKLRLTLEDLTEYGDFSPSERLQYQIEGTIPRE
jgi:hypothetical protein